MWVLHQLQFAWDLPYLSTVLRYNIANYTEQCVNKHASIWLHMYFYRYIHLCI